MTYFLIRKTTHFLFGITAIILLHWLPHLSAYLLALAAILFIIFDLSRRMEGKWKQTFHRIFGKLLKPSESQRRITGATTFLITVTGLSFGFSEEIVIVPILILSISDPLASITGKLYPLKKIWKEKSLTGSATFFLSSLVVYHFFGTASAVPLLFAALMVTLIELLAPEILENILVGFGAAMIFVFIGSL